MIRRFYTYQRYLNFFKENNCVYSHKNNIFNYPSKNNIEYECIYNKNQVYYKKNDETRLYLDNLHNKKDFLRLRAFLDYSENYQNHLYLTNSLCFDLLQNSYSDILNKLASITFQQLPIQDLENIDKLNIKNSIKINIDGISIIPKYLPFYHKNIDLIKNNKIKKIYVYDHWKPILDCYDIPKIYFYKIKSLCDKNELNDISKLIYKITENYQIVYKYQIRELSNKYPYHNYKNHIWRLDLLNFNPSMIKKLYWNLYHLHKYPQYNRVYTELFINRESIKHV